MTAETTEGIGRLLPRHRARVAGTVTALTYQPRGATAALKARVTDDSGSLDLVFLGRREVPGLSPGRRLMAEGMVTTSTSGRAGAVDRDGRPVIFNPAYRFLPEETNP